MIWSDLVLLGLIILCGVILMMTVLEIRRTHCLKKAYIQRDDARMRLVEAFMAETITSSTLYKFTDKLYSVDVADHAKQLFWHDAPCLIYDVELWPYLPEAMFIGYDERTDGDDVVSYVDPYGMTHQFDQPSAAVKPVPTQTKETKND